jgi:hypothetical protein
MSWGAQNRSQDAKNRSTRGTRSDCLIPGSYGIQRYSEKPDKRCTISSLTPSVDCKFRPLPKKAISATNQGSRKKCHLFFFWPSSAMATGRSVHQPWC